jgi:NAD(P)H-nitrite reductase large subunit
LEAENNKLNFRKPFTSGCCYANSKSGNKQNYKNNTISIMPEDPIICTCSNVSKSIIVDAIKEKNLTTGDSVCDETGAGTACGGCGGDIQEILDETIC